MSYYSMNDYKLVKFEKSKTKNKKYDAILKNINTSREIKVPFGHLSYSHYFDKTPNKLYKHLNHKDPVRRKSFRARMKGYLKKGMYSPSYFSYYYLW